MNNVDSKHIFYAQAKEGEENIIVRSEWGSLLPLLSQEEPAITITIFSPSIPTRSAIVRSFIPPPNSLSSSAYYQSSLLAFQTGLLRILPGPGVKLVWSCILPPQNTIVSLDF
jgi:hypothetical protein